MLTAKQVGNGSRSSVFGMTQLRHSNPRPSSVKADTLPQGLRVTPDTVAMHPGAMDTVAMHTETWGFIYNREKNFSENVTTIEVNVSHYPHHQTRDTVSRNGSPCVCMNILC